MGKSYCIPRFCTYNIAIRQIACGDEHASFITKTNLLYTMGSNIEGQLGVGDKMLKYKNSPILVEGLMLQRPKMVACGGAFTAVVLDTGEMCAVTNCLK